MKVPTEYEIFFNWKRSFEKRIIKLLLLLIDHLYIFRRTSWSLKYRVSERRTPVTIVIFLRFKNYWIQRVYTYKI